MKMNGASLHGDRGSPLNPRAQVTQSPSTELGGRRPWHTRGSKQATCSGCVHLN